jgi:hypothetical protein
MLCRTPGFTGVAILTLAVGIGAVTVIYSLLRNVLLDPFPYQHQDRMVDIVLKGRRVWRAGVYRVTAIARDRYSDGARRRTGVTCCR